MKIEAKKIELVQYILSAEGNSLAEKLWAAIQKKEVDFWDELPEGIKAEISLSISQADRGELISHKDAIKQLNHWK
ncbi:MAG: hypothetical protein NTX03_07515 [Bacteroidetes bacterium]|nr:hypothetical protein [Bacteroidota bacterium]